MRRQLAVRLVLAGTALVVLAGCGDASPQPAAPTEPSPATASVTSVVNSEQSELVTDDPELNAVVEELERLESDLDELDVLQDLVDVDGGG